MKSLKIALGIALSTVGVGSGVAFGVSNFASNSDSQVTAESSGYVLTINSFDYREDYEFVKVEGSTDKGQVLGVELDNGSFFKIFKQGVTDSFIGFDSLKDGSAVPFFSDYYHNEIVCGAGSKFNIYLSTNEEIYIDLAYEASVYVQLEKGSTTLYAFDETSDSSYTYEPLGSFPGKTLASSSGNANFNKKGGIAKLTFPIVDPNNTKVIVKNEFKSQTANLDLVDGGYYYNDAGEGLKDLGDAAETVIEIVKEINNAASSSICNISSSIASELYNQYNGLSSGAKSAVNNSTLWTYKSADMSEGNTDISFVDIVNRLSILSNNASSSNFILPLSKNEYGMALLVFIVSLLSVSIIVFFLIKRKRHQ